MKPRGMAETRLTIILAAMGFFLSIARCSVMLFDYPYMFPDSFDWLVNGLQYSGLLGEQLELSHRSMLLTMLYAGLFKMGRIDWAPAVGTIAHTALAIFVLRFPAEQLPLRVRVIAALFIFFSFTLLGQSAFIGADVLANCLATMCCLMFLRFVLAPRGTLLYPLAIAGALGVHSQNIFPILAPTFLTTLVIGIRNNQRGALLRTLISRDGVVAVFLFVVLTLSFLAPRLYFYHSFYEERVQQASLVTWDLAGTRYYVEGFLASFSPLIALLALLGAVSRSGRALACDPSRFLFITWIANIFIFFAWLYSWRDIRFWIYASAPVYFLAAIGLDSLLSRDVFRKSLFSTKLATRSPRGAGSDKRAGQTDSIPREGGASHSDSSKLADGAPVDGFPTPNPRDLIPVAPGTRVNKYSESVGRTTGAVSKAAVFGFCLFAAHCTPSIDPWDSLVPITPFQALEFDAHTGGHLLRTDSKPYLYVHLQELRESHLQSVNGGFSSRMRDSALRVAVRDALTHIGQAPLAIFSVLTPPDHYIAKNRNILYAMRAVRTVSTPAEVRRYLQEGRYVMLLKQDVARMQALTSGYGDIREVRPIGGQGSEYVLVSVLPTAATSSEDKVVTADIEERSDDA